MPILVSCECGLQSRTDDGNAGMSAVCPNCGRAQEIPLSSRDVSVVSGAPFSGRAIASLALGVLSMAVAALTGLPAIILGGLAVADIRRSRGRLKGVTLAAAGIALGTFGTTVMSVVIPVNLYRMIREPMNQQVCTNNLKVIGLAFHNFHSARGSFPNSAIRGRVEDDAETTRGDQPPVPKFPNGPIRGPKGEPLLSWRVAILPFLGAEEAKLYGRFHLKEPWDSPHNLALLKEMPAVYRCPDAPVGKPGMTVYQMLIGPGTPFDGKRKTVTIEDIYNKRLWSAVLVMETDTPVPWTAPRDVVNDPNAATPLYQGFHPEDVRVLNVDGSVRRNPSSPPPKTAATSPAQRGWWTSPFR